MGNMITFSGKSFDPENTKPDQIELLDIAVALSRIPRFVGHTVFHYSVAQHSMLVADLVKPIGKEKPEYIRRLKILAMLHDADEAYTSDIPSPVKQFLKPAISEVEAGIMSAIYKHFKIEPPTDAERVRIKSYDNKAYEIENHYLRGQEVFNSVGNPFIHHDSPSLVPLDPNLVALVFMREFNQLLR